MAGFVLGRGGRVQETLRGGALSFESRKGLPPQVAALVEALPPRAPGSVLTGHDTEGVPALAALALWPGADVVVHEPDAYVAAKVARTLRRNGVEVEPAVTADLPPGAHAPYALAALPFPTRGGALLMREWIEQAHDRLAVGGRLLASVDGPPARLLRVVREVFGRADVQAAGRRAGVVSARRTRERSRARERRHVLRVPRGSRTLQIATRPGVFVYGRMDAGTRALLGAFTAAPGSRVLDLGCGTGVLGLAAAVDAGGAPATLVDSNARAVGLARENARANGLDGVTVLLRADLEDLPERAFDLVLCNPPYFSRGRIAAAFAAAGARALAAEGRLLLVARNAELHEGVLAEHFGNVVGRPAGAYTVLEATAPGARPPRGGRGHSRSAVRRPAKRKAPRSKTKDQRR